MLTGETGIMVWDVAARVGLGSGRRRGCSIQIFTPTTFNGCACHVNKVLASE